MLPRTTKTPPNTQNVNGAERVQRGSSEASSGSPATSAPARLSSSARSASAAGRVSASMRSSLRSPLEPTVPARTTANPTLSPYA
ncbi:hypothetical protein HUO13_22720 [Saccharopolyspora erythraea]|uniref:hypothetical protein n=1 Tax=Saccharopolyspora erythraea TaxID=1836 RepID=UPI001BAC1AE6|nr:hypothetical protein [Saccharopolyspora erythraea]QUH03269.1 hypothetical protein HUO13_22720 [Saccharopolyspora erythraea]